MSAYLFPALKSRFGNIKVLKKWNAYFSISTPMFVFKDAYLFTSPCTLSKYLSKELILSFKLISFNTLFIVNSYKRQNDVVEQKSVFPYTRYSSVEEMRLDVDFPPHSAFLSELKNANISSEDYNEARSEFYRRKSLPATDRNHINDMSCWLRYYNELDTAPLAQAIDNSFRNFFDIFGIDPCHYTSLPKFAQDCMFKSYSSDAPLCYSYFISQSDLRQFTRENLTGGLVNCFHRCIDLSGRSGMPKASQFAPNGRPYKSLMFFDFNSLYLYAQLLPFPSTPGKFYFFFRFHLFLLKAYIGKRNLKVIL